MEIKHFQFVEYINWHKENWVGDLSLNGGEKTFGFIVKSGKITFNETNKNPLLELALKDSRVKEALEYIETTTKEIEDMRKLEKEKTYSIHLINYQSYEENEDFVFKINSSNVEIMYHLYEREINSLVARSDNMPLIAYFDHLFSKEFNENLIEVLRNHPKARIRRLFKE